MNDGNRTTTSATGPAALAAGTMLRSSTATYAIRRCLGQGGFGITYLAEVVESRGGRSVGSLVAVKEHFMKSCMSRDRATGSVTVFEGQRTQAADSRRDFRTEAMRLQNVGVRHTNIVKIDEVFDANDTSYYVMEYLEGESLGDYVKREGALSENRAMAIILPIVNAVSTLHLNNITHLDIKPDNIMLAHEGGTTVRPVLIDFGLSKHYDDDGNPTSTVNTMGYSEGYAPIEQHSGINKFMPRADVYALGAVMFFMLTGHRPPESTSRDGERDIEPALSNVRQSFREKILHAMSPFASGRYASAALLFKDLIGKIREPITIPWTADLSDDATVIINTDDDEATEIVNADDDATRTVDELGVEVERPGWLKRQCLAMKTGADIIVFYVLAFFAMFCALAVTLDVFQDGFAEIFMFSPTVILLPSLLLFPLLRGKAVKIITLICGLVSTLMVVNVEYPKISSFQDYYALSIIVSYAYGMIRSYRRPRQNDADETVIASSPLLSRGMGMKSLVDVVIFYVLAAIAIYQSIYCFTTEIDYGWLDTDIRCSVLVLSMIALAFARGRVIKVISIAALICFAAVEYMWMANLWSGGEIGIYFSALIISFPALILFPLAREKYIKVIACICGAIVVAMSLLYGGSGSAIGLSGYAMLSRVAALVYGAIRGRWR
jgi:serine/threonine protein kinase